MYKSFSTGSPFDKVHKTVLHKLSKASRTQIAEACEIILVNAHGARPWRPCDFGLVAPQYVEAELLFGDGEGGGYWGRRSLSSPGRAAIFAKGKETGLRGSNF